MFIFKQTSHSYCLPVLHSQSCQTWATLSSELLSHIHLNYSATHISELLSQTYLNSSSIPKLLSYTYLSYWPKKTGDYGIDSSIKESTFVLSSRIFPKVIERLPIPLYWTIGAYVSLRYNTRPITTPMAPLNPHPNTNQLLPRYFPKLSFNN